MYQSNLSNLLHKYNRNLRGVCAAIAVPKEGVASMPDVMSLMERLGVAEDNDFWVEEIILKSGYNWLDLTPDFNLHINFGEETRESIHNNVASYELALAFPNDDFVARGKVLRAYDEREFIIIVKQHSGAWRVMGSIERGAVFTTKYTSGTVIKDASRYAGSFNWALGAGRAFYVESFEAEEYFEINYDAGAGKKFELTIDEPVNYSIGGAAAIAAITPVGIAQQIQSDLPGTDAITVRVYHRSLAKVINLEEDGDYNGDILSLTGSLPDTLQALLLLGNKFTALPTTQFTNNMVEVDARENNLDTTAVDTILIALASLTADDGVLQLEDQTPAGVPSVFGLVGKTALEGRGWTVTHD